MSKGAAFANALAQGLNGYIRGKQLKEHIDQNKLDNAWRDEQREWQRQDRAQRENERAAIADAATPMRLDAGYRVTDAAGSDAFTKDADAAAALQDMAQGENGGVTLANAARTKAPGAGNQRVHTDMSLANQEVQAYNAPQAQTQRVVSAMRSAGDHKGAQAHELAGIQLAAGKIGLQKTQIDMDEAERKRGRMVQEEGVIDGLQGLRRGDAQAMMAGFNKSGQYKIVGEPKITPEERELPGYGKVKSYTATFDVALPDGGTKPMTVNSHDLSMQLMPYEKQLETQRKGTDTDARVSKSLADIENKSQLLELRGRLTEAQIAKADRGAAPKGLSSMDRMLIDGRAKDAKREVADLEEKLSDPLLSVAKPGTPAGDRRARLEAQLAAAQAEHTRWSGALSELADTAAARNGVGAAPAAPAPAGRPAVDQPKRVTTAAERDALPKGARYIAPDGQTYIKR